MKKSLVAIATVLIIIISMVSILSGCKKDAIVSDGDNKKTATVFEADNKITAAVSEGDKVIATVNGKNLYNRDFLVNYNYYISMYEQNGITIDTSTEEGKAQAESIKQGVRSEMVRIEVARQLAEAAGYMKFTDAEKATLRTNFNTKVKASIDGIITELKTTAPNATSAELTKAATDKFWKQVGMTSDQAFKTVLDQSGIDKYQTAYDIKPAIKDAYDTVKAAQKATYTATAETSGTAGSTTYESDIAAGSLILYNLPNNIRVKHILIKLTDADAQTVSDWRSAAVNEEGASDAAKDKAVDKKRDALVKKSLGTEANKVLALVNKKGSDFNKLIETYGKDPGMSDAGDSKTNGYLLCPTSGYVKEFLAAAIKLKTVGQTTGLVATDYGYHIIKLVKKIPAGFVPLSTLSATQQAEIIKKANLMAYDAMITEKVAVAKIVNIS